MTGFLDLVRLRPMREADLNFIRSSWLRSNARTIPDGLVGRDAYFALHWEVAMALLDRPRTRCVMAVSRDDEDHLVGWACGEAAEESRPVRGLVHYAYVKKPFRRNGVARALVEEVLRAGPSSQVTATHLPTESMRERLEARGWVFRPQFAFYLAAEGEKGDQAA